MAINLNTLSSKELDTLINQAKKRKDTLKKRKPITTVRNQLIAAAKRDGYTIEELFGQISSAKTTGAKRGPAPGKKRVTKAKRSTAGKKVPAKYRNPSNAQETWTGRGKQPLWVANLVKRGQKLESLLIKK